VQRVDHHELRFLHRLRHTSARQITLTLAAGGFHLGGAFGLLVLLAHVLQAHFQPLVALDLAAQDYAVLMGGVSIARGAVRPGKLLAIDAGEVRPGHGLTGEPTRDPSFDCPALWIAPAARDHAIAEGFLVVDSSTVIATHANQALLAEAHQLLGPDDVREWVEGLKAHAPALVEAVHPDPLPLAALTRTLRTLVADGIGLAHPQPLFTALALALQKNPDFDAVIDAVRADLSGRLVARIAAPGEAMKVVTLDAGLEAAILGGMIDPNTSQPLIEPDCGSMIIREINAVADAQGGPIALIVQPPARRALTTLLKPRAPRCLVLSIAELPASQAIAVVGVIGAADEAPTLAPPQPEALAA
jgi:flagellar biosynthesis protein FlhA